MGKQVGGPDPYIKQFMLARKMLIQSGVKKPSNKAIMEAMKNLPSEPVEGQKPDKGLGVEQGSPSQAGTQQPAMPSSLRQTMNNVRIMANQAFMAQATMLTHTLNSEIARIQADEILTNEQKNDQIQQLNRQAEAKTLELESFMNMYEKQVIQAHQALQNLRNTMDDEIKEINNNSALTDAQKQQQIQNLVMQYQEKETTTLSMLNTYLDNSLNPQKAPSVDAPEPHAIPSGAPAAPSDEPGVPSSVPEPDVTCGGWVPPEGPSES